MNQHHQFCLNDSHRHLDRKSVARSRLYQRQADQIVLLNLSHLFEANDAAEDRPRHLDRKSVAKSRQYQRQADHIRLDRKSAARSRLYQRQADHVRLDRKSAARSRLYQRQADQIVLLNLSHLFETNDAAEDHISSQIGRGSVSLIDVDLNM